MKLLGKITLITVTLSLAPWVVGLGLWGFLSPGTPLGVIAAGVLVCQILGLGWFRFLVKRLGQLAEQTERLGAGDLSLPAGPGPRSRWPDEIDLLCGSVDGIRAQVRKTLSTVRTTMQQANQSSSSLTEEVQKIHRSAEEIARSIKEISMGAELQSELVEKTSALSMGMARSIERTSRSAEDAAKSSAEASVTARSGSQLAGQAVEKMRGVFEGIEKYAHRVFEFGERTKEIGNIVRVITEVAQQTHLLAINATIEAARAGDAGRGFAVVAEEIRQLAENTSRSAERISGIVEEVAAGSKEAVQAVQASTQHLSEGRDQLSSILNALKNIATTVTSGSDRVQIISRLAREQIAGAEETVKAVTNISHLALRNASSTEAVSSAVEAQGHTILEVSRLAEEVANLAGVLEQEIQRFRLEGARGEDHGGT